MAQDLPHRVGVLVVGTGFAGLGTAIGLLREGRRDLLVLERAESVGGTWRDNRYPGCACDVPSHLYSFSFAPNPRWSRSFSQQPEIEAYLRRVAEESGVLPFVRFGTELQDARWDEGAQEWEVETSRGSLRAGVLVLGTGGLSEPAVPDLPGLSTFAGTTFHSAAWKTGHDVTGERVGVVGTGASAIQFVPHLQRRARELVLFQRTAPWVMPRADRRLTRLEQRLFARVPGAQRAARAGIWALRESWLVGFTRQPAVMAVAERIAKRHLASAVSDPVLRDRLTPRYRLGCKRVLISNDYYPALAQDNARVETDRIVEVTPRGVVTRAADGTRTEHPLDTLVLGTGFRVTDPPVAHRVTGRSGRTLGEVWKERGMQALHGSTVAGFPNLFFLSGPNTGLGHTSVVLMIEAQVRYVLDALAKMAARGLTSIEPRQEAQDAWNARVQRDLDGTVWSTGGCSSWYVDASGRNTTLWPTWTTTFRRELASCDLAQYETRSAAAVAA